MIFLSLVVLLSFGMQQSTDEQESLVRCVCGTVVYEHEVRGSAGVVHYKTKPAREVGLTLYERQTEASCCENLSPVFSVETNRSGKFKGKGVHPGRYWLVIRANATTFVAPIRYERMKDYSPSSSVYTFALTDAGDLNVGVAVTVD